MYEKEQFPALFQYDCPAGKEEFQSGDISKHIKENLFLSIQCQLRFTNATFFKINYLYVEVSQSKMVPRKIIQSTNEYRVGSSFLLFTYLLAIKHHTQKGFAVQKKGFSLILTHEVDSSILLKTTAPS